MWLFFLPSYPLCFAFQGLVVEIIVNNHWISVIYNTAIVIANPKRVHLWVVPIYVGLNWIICIHTKRMKTQAFLTGRFWNGFMLLHKFLSRICSMKCRCRFGDVQQYVCLCVVEMEKLETFTSSAVCCAIFTLHFWYWILLLANCLANCHGLCHEILIAMTWH